MIDNKHLITTLYTTIIAFISLTASFAQAQDNTQLLNSDEQKQVQNKQIPELQQEDTIPTQVVYTRPKEDASKEKPKLHYTDGRRARWKQGFDISVQGGSNGTTQLMVVPTNIGLSTSISLGYHGEFVGFTAQYEAGRLYDIGTLPNDHTQDEEMWTFFDDMKDYFHSVSLTLDFYAQCETLIFRFGVGAALFSQMPWSKDKLAGGLRLESSWQWPISKHLRAGFELELTTAFLWNYWRPSMVVTIVI